MTWILKGMSSSTVINFSSASASLVPTLITLSFAAVLTSLDSSSLAVSVVPLYVTLYLTSALPFTPSCSVFSSPRGSVSSDFLITLKGIVSVTVSSFVEILSSGLI